uniref:Uncharacterized protein n=1 Tax=Ralstonia solanacearum TaxID=305 RepID=A0A0S4TUE1_RALSL|nr:protein of unknown function [Ralstonia solanacearum]
MNGPPHIVCSGEYPRNLLQLPSGDHCIYSLLKNATNLTACVANPKST